MTNNQFHTIPLLLFLIISFLPLPVQAEIGLNKAVNTVDNVLAPFYITLDNTVRSDYYDVGGDKTSSPYRFEDFQTYDQFNLGVTHRSTPFNLWRGQVFGIINDSDYRSPDNGFVLERLNLFHERGDTAVPYRVEVGDLYGYFSFRTLQRSLKGIQVELQPFGTATAGRRHSVLFVSGANQSSWRHFQLEDNYTNGLSYLLEDETFGRWGLNFVYNTRQGNMAAGSLRRNQRVISLTGEKRLEIASQHITAEGELGYFNGDHNGISGAKSGQDRNDLGIYFQLGGRGTERPYNYRIRFEQYGQDYRPEGSVATPDRRSEEVHLGWNFLSGMRLQGRFQNFRTNYETSNPLDTMIYGLNFSGPVIKKINMSGSLDAFIQDVENRNKTTNNIASTVNINLNQPLYAGWNGRFGLFYQETNSQVAGVSDAAIKQISLAADHGLDFHGVKGSIAPGVVARKLTLSNNGFDLFPSLAVNLAKDRHSLGYNMSFNVQDRSLPNSVDVTTFSHNLNYRYTMTQNTFGVELSEVERNPKTGQETSSFRGGLFWRYFFDKPAGKKMKAQETVAMAVAGEDAAQRVPVITPIDLSDLKPGYGMKQIETKLKKAGISGGIEQSGGLVVYETRMLEEIDQRQRLALVYNAAGKLKKAALIIEFDVVGGPDDMMQTFERVRKLLADQYGRPTNFFDRGVPGTDIINDINNDAFIRITEWSHPEGGIIRLGVPRRLDRQVRMEVQFAKTFPPVTETLWSVEDVR